MTEIQGEKHRYLGKVTKLLKNQWFFSQSYTSFYFLAQSLPKKATQLFCIAETLHNIAKWTKIGSFKIQ